MAGVDLPSAERVNSTSRQEVVREYDLTQVSNMRSGFHPQAVDRFARIIRVWNSVKNFFSELGSKIKDLGTRYLRFWAKHRVAITFATLALMITGVALMAIPVPPVQTAGLAVFAVSGLLTVVNAASMAAAVCTGNLRLR